MKPIFILLLSLSFSFAIAAPTVMTTNGIAVETSVAGDKKDDKKKKKKKSCCKGKKAGECSKDEASKDKGCEGKTAGTKPCCASAKSSSK